jgi:hypothetical protein
MGFLGGLLGGAGAGAAGAGAAGAAAPAAAGAAAALPQVAPGLIQMAPGLAGPTMGAADAVAAGLGQSGALGSGFGQAGWTPSPPLPAGSQLLYPGGTPETSLPIGGAPWPSGGGAAGGAPSGFWQSPFGRYAQARYGIGPRQGGGEGGGFDSPTGPAPDDRPALPAGSQLLYPGGTPETSIPIGGAPWPTGQPAPQPSGFWQSPFGRFVQARYGVGPRRGAGGGDDLDQILTYLLRQTQGPPARTLPVTGGLPGNNQFYW